MKTIHLTQMRGVALYLIILILAACSVSEKEALTATPLQPSPTHISTVKLSPTSSPVSTLSSIEQTPTSTATPIQTVTPTTEITHTPTLVATPSSLQGPIVAYRIQNEESYLLLLDVGTLTFREIRKDFLAYPFRMQWLDKGCHLYVRGNVIDLQGNIIEEVADWEDENSPFKFFLLSPDRNWGVNEIFLGINEEEASEYLSLEILNRYNPALRTSLAPNKGAFSYAWSPDGEWLAFSDYDENHIMQVYQATPDGQTIQQLTFHTEPTGIINLLAWAPNGQRIAYAASTLLPAQFERGDEGWIGLISLPGLESTKVTPSQFAYARGLWWSSDSNRIITVGESLPTVPVGDPLHGTQIHWADGDTGTILNSFHQTQAPLGFSLVSPVGNIDTVLFRAEDGYYLLDATTNNYEKIIDKIETNELVRGFSPSPFEFSGESVCSNE